jgi:prolyl-tRNA editing enzyme YbaK/EbsC (Cys-tRNA(Pro) deacylase)
MIMKSNKDLLAFVKENKISAEIKELKDRTQTTKEAAAAIGIGINQIAKSIVFATPSGKGILAVLKGADRVDYRKLKSAAGHTCNTASPQEVLKLTGYAVGGVPPVSTGVETYIDSKVMDLEECCAGAGTPHHLVKMKPNDILKFSNGKVVELSE